MELQFRPDPARKLHDIYHCCGYSEKLLLMDRGTVGNVEFYSKNKFEKLVHLVGFIIRIIHDARSSERPLSLFSGSVFISGTRKSLFLRWCIYSEPVTTCFRTTRICSGAWKERVVRQMLNLKFRVDFYQFVLVELSATGIITQDSYKQKPTFVTE